MSAEIEPLGPILLQSWSIPRVLPCAASEEVGLRFVSPVLVAAVRAGGAEAAGTRPLGKYAYSEPIDYWTLRLRRSVETIPTESRGLQVLVSLCLSRSHSQLV